MKAILGVSAYYHDSAATLVCDGRIVAAAQEERFTRIKHDPAFPIHAIDFCLSEAGLEISDVDYLVFYEKPLKKFDRILETYLAFAPSGFGSFSKALPIWLKQKLFHPREIRRGLRGEFKGKIVFLEHHESHAASAFYPSPFEEAAILTLDGVGEWATGSLSYGSGNQLTMLQETHFPHSLGLLYSAVTYYCGFKVNSGEYKLMGLAPYGEPTFADTIREHLIRIYPDGSIWMDMQYFNYCQGLTMTGKKFDRLFGRPPRKPESQLESFHMDMAASVQKVTEEVVMKMARHAKKETGANNLCLAGGVALNCVANGKLLRENIFDNIWIQPASGDAGGSLGAALFAWHQLLENPRNETESDIQGASYLGSEYSDEQVVEYLSSEDADFRTIDDEGELLATVAKAIGDGQVVGWFHGKMEFGPRALGSRSILGDPRNVDMQLTMNRKIKFRESFRPFAPCVLEEDVNEYFELDSESPYMLLVADVLERHRTQFSEEEQKLASDPDLRKRVTLKRSSLPAVTHVDYSARIQTVDHRRHGRFYRLLQAFKELTGCGVVINTSFNIRGEPIVCSPADAYRCFLNTDMDVLVLESTVLFKSNQRNLEQKMDGSYRTEFKLD